MQNKGFQALIWLLYETQSDYFTEDEKSIINKYIVPSYFEDDFKLNDNGETFIVKPIWGREGNKIKLIKNNKILYAKQVNVDNIVQRNSLSSSQVL